ncbi:hypothetical protein DPMN_128493 [Dreissena polymorpha]|uniref:Uncharacterized protein n=1 Tax=Dreissena polymorpha TaxID=45954 RepID=A0A9D4GZL6_DREPO|nr:hypothetical protein DPMN_128493 [Dreissena polymorpha]
MRLFRFQEFLSNSDEDWVEMNRRNKLKTLCETRWATRADALFTFKASFETVVCTLEDIAQNNDAKDGAFKAAIT